MLKIPFPNIHIVLNSPDRVNFSLYKAYIWIQALGQSLTGFDVNRYCCHECWSLLDALAKEQVDEPLMVAGIKNWDFAPA